MSSAPLGPSLNLHRMSRMATIAIREGICAPSSSSLFRTGSRTPNPVEWLSWNCQEKRLSTGAEWPYIVPKALLSLNQSETRFSSYPGFRRRFFNVHPIAVDDGTRGVTLMRNAMHTRASVSESASAATKPKVGKMMIKCMFLRAEINVVSCAGAKSLGMTRS
jgi:hypothetical protein